MLVGLDIYKCTWESEWCIYDWTSFFTTLKDNVKHTCSKGVNDEYITMSIFGCIINTSKLSVSQSLIALILIKC